ncbi:SufD family Fe-S cluster assembly protein, partial [Patescibacteria group bacterium]
GGDYVVRLVGDGAEVEILGGFLVEGNDSLKVDLKIVHEARHTKADTLIKAVVGGSGEVDIRGKIIVEKNSQQTESFLNENVLLVSSKAKAIAIPDLEIEANEVKCSHAATVATIDDEQTFYLMSRGILRRKAEEMIVEGFLQPVWDKISSNQ